VRQVVRRVIDPRGRIRVIELPEPDLGPDQVLVRNEHSLISTGTELSTLAKTPFELVRQTVSDPWMRHVVKQTVLSAGPSQTAGRIWHEMTALRELGYSGAGRILALGSNVSGLAVGQRVAYAAAGHAETVAPGLNHVVPVPDEVPSRHAAFVTVGGIALHAVRRAGVGLGEVVAVYGLGLVGQLAARIARAAGCVVVGIDLDPERVRLAERGGADLGLGPDEADPVRRIRDLTGKQGVDATIVTARSDSSEIVNRSMEITRKQGKVVLVGYVGLDVHPKSFLYKEIDLRYSRAYGPGSYDNSYEKGRIDYPSEYVRWTERRNLEEVIRLLGGPVDVEPLIGQEYPIERAQEAFDALRAGTLGGVAALLSYGSGDAEADRRRTLPVAPGPVGGGEIGISIVGCGNHVLAQHLPNLARLKDVRLRALVSATGKNAVTAAKRHGPTVVTSELDEALSDPGTRCVMICSSQQLHADQAVAAIEAGKAVFVEKPMATRREGFERIAAAHARCPGLVTLGLNRRYSPLVDRLREEMAGGIEAVTYHVAQAFLPLEHWTLDPIEGGGRLVSEGEHFIDVCNLLIGRAPTSVFATHLGDRPDDLRRLCDFAVTLHYPGAAATIAFHESGGVGFPRERVTAMGRGRVAVLDDFARLTVHGRKERSWGRGTQARMGHREQLRELVAALRGEPNRLLGWEEASLATRSMFAAQESLRTGEPVLLSDLAPPPPDAETAAER
jgi:predicted dehydrogenase/threonine dehydrogenase-like Zn-dependent dehydrogenase